MDNKGHLKWLEWAKELQFHVQSGLTYTTDDFDKVPDFRPSFIENAIGGDTFPVSRLNPLNQHGFSVDANFVVAIACRYYLQANISPVLESVFTGIYEKSSEVVELQNFTSIYQIFWRCGRDSNPRPRA